MTLADPGEFNGGIISTTYQNGLRDLGKEGLNPPSAIADRIAAQSIPNNTTTSVSFDTEVFDGRSMFVATSATILIAEPGVYIITAGGTWAANATGARIGTIRHNGNDVNGGTWEEPALTGGAQTFMSHCASIFAAGGDTVTYAVTQTSGGALNISACRVGVHRVSGT